LTETDFVHVRVKFMFLFMSEVCHASFSGQLPMRFFSLLSLKTL
jgi:hypothetical protein